MLYKLAIIDMIVCLTLWLVFKALIWARRNVFKSTIGKSKLNGVIRFVVLSLIFFLLCIPAILISAIWSI